MEVETKTLIFWDNVRHFRQSDTEGGGWNSSPEGIFRIQQYQNGKARFTYHNPLTKVCGLNMMFVQDNPLFVKGASVYFKGRSITGTGMNVKRCVHALLFKTEIDAKIFKTFWNLYTVFSNHEQTMIADENTFFEACPAPEEDPMNRSQDFERSFKKKKHRSSKN